MTNPKTGLTMPSFVPQKKAVKEPNMAVMPLLVKT